MHNTTKIFKRQYYLKAHNIFKLVTKEAKTKSFFFHVFKKHFSLRWLSIHKQLLRIKQRDSMSIDQASQNGNILYNYCILLQPGIWYNSLTLLRFFQFYIFFYVFLFSSVQFYTMCRSVGPTTMVKTQNSCISSVLHAPYSNSHLPFSNLLRPWQPLICSLSLEFCDL